MDNVSHKIITCVLLLTIRSQVISQVDGSVNKQVSRQDRDDGRDLLDREVDYGGILLNVKEILSESFDVEDQIRR